MTNKFAGKCTKCGEQVALGDGECNRSDGKWVITHTTCPAELAAQRAASEQAYLSTMDTCDGCHGDFYRGQLIKVEECWDGPYSRLCPDCATKTWMGGYPVAIETARNFQAVTGESPRVAMLSFSTKGSAQHDDVDKVVRATKMAKDKAPDLVIDGEMQADAALVASVGERKCKGSPVAGKANVLVFPDLDAGNIGYKLTERLAATEAVGPIVQGLRKPFCDLSRGCSVDDMVNVAAICSLMA